MREVPVILIKLMYAADRCLTFFVRIVAAGVFMLAVCSFFDAYGPEDKTLPYRDGTWLMIDGTNIDHRIMQGSDNFEYLSKNPEGDYYQGGSLFLDYRNDPSFKDEYSIIYGHNMAGGKMFADLDNFFDRDFFKSHKTGMLCSKNRSYRLMIIGVLSCDAYTDGIYHPRTINDAWKKEFRKCRFTRGYRKGQKILAMSTCSGTMDDSRIVVFARVIEKSGMEE